MELVMTNGFAELSANEMMAIDGGVDWGWVGSGVAVLGAGCLAVMCAPAACFVGAAYVGTLACGAAIGAGAGMMVGQGLIS